MHGAGTGSGLQPLESGECGYGTEATAGSWPRTALRRVRRAAWPAGAAVTALVVFLCALREARTLGVNSDGASNALQAWAMLHGNPLLHGWYLGDASFYTTELPEYMLVESVRGLRPDVVYVSAAITYTLLVLLAALVAKGRATGRAGAARAAIAVGIMLAPSLSAVGNLLSSPDHTGSAVPVLAVLALLDWAGRRWYVPLLTGLLLAWAVVGDPLVLLIGVVPVLVVCLARAGNKVVRLRDPLRDVRYELSLAGAAVIAAGAAFAADHVIRASGGYVLAGSMDQFMPSAALMPGNVAGTGQDILSLFSADFFGERFGPGLVVTAMHLISVALVAVAVWLAIRRFFWTADLAVAILATAIIANVLAYLVIFPASSWYVHEMAPVVSLGAALAGRVLTGPLLQNRLEPLLALLLACWALTLAPPILQGEPAPANTSLAAWLEAHHLYDGISGYWLANLTTLNSGGQVTMRAVMDTQCSGVTPMAWETDAALLNSRAYYVNFFLTDSQSIAEGAAAGEFGKPAWVYHFQTYTILTWRKNLLPRLDRNGLPPLARSLDGSLWQLLEVSDPGCVIIQS
jgi:hypothetical protein